MLFEERSRTDLAPKLHRESDFAFLERSGLPGMDPVRGILNRWLTRYPVAHAPDLVGRFRSGTDANWRSATFELLLHELLLRLGCTCDPHPPLPNGSSARPDVLAIDREGFEFYVEAVSSGQLDGRNPAAEAMKESVFDAFDGETRQSCAKSDTGSH